MSLLYEFKCMKFSNRHTELWYYKSGEWLPKDAQEGFGIWSQFVRRLTGGHMGAFLLCEIH